MWMAIIALLGIVRGGVAIDATGMRQHRIHLLPGRETFGARLCVGGGGSADRHDDKHARADRNAMPSVHALTVARQEGQLL